MNNQTLAWRLISGESNISKKGSLRENDILQLRGIFLSLDDDKDGLLSTTQLGEALRLLGFIPREKLIKKFATNLNQMRIMGLNEMSFKTDFKTFVTILSKEIKALVEIENEISGLFEFMDSNGSGMISKKELRHLLVETISPFSLSGTEYAKFVRNISFPSNSEYIKISELKRQVLFGLN